MNSGFQQGGGAWEASALPLNYAAWAAFYAGLGGGDNVAGWRQFREQNCWTYALADLTSRQQAWTGDVQNPVRHSIVIPFKLKR
jgi:hypothetical protein